jgi:DNA polymerase-3 subunit delta
MLIKYQTLSAQLEKSLSSIYVLTGTELFLINQAAVLIKEAWGESKSVDKKTLTVQSPTDWALVAAEANSYSLFADHILLEVYFDKKTLDSTSKKELTRYVENPNLDCVLIIHASQVPIKQLTLLSNNPNVTVVQTFSLNATEFETWVRHMMKKRELQYAPLVPKLICEYTQGNLQAAFMAIEKLSLAYDTTETISLERAKQQLIQQAEFKLYELTDTCLLANKHHTIRLLRLAYNNREEPSLLLWVLTQELRKLIDLAHLLKQGLGISDACSSLNIWSSRIKLYQNALSRLPLSRLYQLLHESKRIDDLIKTSLHEQYIWQSFDQLALGIAQ